MQTLAARKNKYNGMIIDAASLPGAIDNFTARLQASISAWQQDNIALAWLSLPRERAELITAAVTAGFVFHHCNQDQLTLTLALQNNTFVPNYAAHCIGAGAVIISDKNEVLTVLEKQDAVERPEHYKLPGGMLEPGEHIADAVVREVYEETGIKARFESLLGLRHHHRGQFGTSNMYFVCRLNPLNREIKIDPTEITDAQWIPVDDYLARDSIGLLNKHIVAAALQYTGLKSIKLGNYMENPDAYEVFSLSSGGDTGFSG